MTKKDLIYEVHKEIASKIEEFYHLFKQTNRKLPDNFEVLLSLKKEDVREILQDVLEQTFYYFLLSKFYDIKIVFNYNTGETPLYKYVLRFERK